MLINLLIEWRQLITVIFIGCAYIAIQKINLFGYKFLSMNALGTGIFFFQEA